MRLWAALSTRFICLRSIPWQLSIFPRFPFTPPPPPNPYFSTHTLSSLFIRQFLCAYMYSNPCSSRARGGKSVVFSRYIYPGKTATRECGSERELWLKARERHKTRNCFRQGRLTIYFSVFHESCSCYIYKYTVVEPTHKDKTTKKKDQNQLYLFYFYFVLIFIAVLLIKIFVLQNIPHGHKVMRFNYIFFQQSRSLRRTSYTQWAYQCAGYIYSLMLSWM